jgi:RNA polymerase sigma-70 factor (ECF subfamily)
MEGVTAGAASPLEGRDVDNHELKRVVRSASRGDEHAAGALFDLYYQRVYRFALVRLGSSQDAEDVASETFAKLLRSLDRFRWKGSGFEAWLFRIASNLVVDHYRVSGRERPDDEIIERSLPLDERDPESALLEDERATELTAMMRDLPPDQQEVLAMRFGAELDPAEIARATGRTSNAVRQLQFRALTNLRKRMTQ